MAFSSGSFSSGVSVFTGCEDADACGLVTGATVAVGFGVAVTVVFDLLTVTRITAFDLPLVAVILQLPAAYAVIFAFLLLSFLTLAIFAFEDFQVTFLFA